MDERGLTDAEINPQERIRELQESMRKMEHGDFGDLTEDEAEKIYDKYDEELQELLKHHEPAPIEFRVLREGEYDKFFTEQEEYKKWTSTLSERDLETIDEYTSNDFWSYNQIKREGPDAFLNNPMYRASPTEYLQDVVKRSDELVEILGRYRTEESFTTFRGMNGKLDITKKNIGDIHEFDSGFMSTSVDRSITNKFTMSNNKVTYEIKVDKGLNVGSYLADHSRNKFEKEFLFKPNAKFKIIDVENVEADGQSFQHVIMEALNDE